MSDKKQTPFERTTCDCLECRTCCEHKPGMLIPSDLERIAAHMGMEPDWLDDWLAASDGALALLFGVPIRIPTIVPRQYPDGRCYFLQHDGHCAIHKVAPFGCAHCDPHMDFEEGQKRSNWAHLEVMGSEAYAERHAGLKHKARPLAERQARLERAYATIEN